MRKRAIVSLVLTLFFTLSGCGLAGASESANASTGTNQKESTETVESVAVENTSEMFTDRDMEIGYDQETSVTITLSGNSISSDSDAVQISGSTVTVTEEGTYIFTGTLNNGMIVIDAENTDKIQLILDGVNITNTTSAAIYILEADKVFITTTDGSENVLSNGGQYVAIDDNNIDAVIFSKSDLTLNGAGKLTVNATAGHGIVSKDDLIFTSGTYNITAENHGISAKDSVRIANGNYTIVSGKDGIHAENTEDTSLGFLYVSGGTFEITADGDGVSASAYLQLEAGEFTITTGEGSSSVTMPTDTMNFGQRPGTQTENATTEEENTVSQKGLKADGTIIIRDGSIIADTVDDSIHAGGNITVSGGEFELQSGDDAMHSDAAVVIENGTCKIAYCYEGIEGLSVTIKDGSFHITSVDDGINSAGGVDNSGLRGRGPEQDQISASSDSYITISGGDFVIVSTGDCIDSNGALTINGGTLDLTCNGNGNTAVDCDGTYTNSGGDVTTNDGSENNPGQMGGGMAGQGKMKQGRNPQ